MEDVCYCGAWLNKIVTKKNIDIDNNIKINNSNINNNNINNSNINNNNINNNSNKINYDDMLNLVRIL